MGYLLLAVVFYTGVKYTFEVWLRYREERESKIYREIDRNLLKK